MTTLYARVELAYGEGIEDTLTGRNSASMLDGFVGNYIIVEKKNLSKLKVTFIFSSPAKLRREGIESGLNKQIPQEYHGSIDWEVAYK